MRCQGGKKQSNAALPPDPEKCLPPPLGRLRTRQGNQRYQKRNICFYLWDNINFFANFPQVFLRGGKRKAQRRYGAVLCGERNKGKGSQASASPREECDKAWAQQEKRSLPRPSGRQRFQGQPSAERAASRPGRKRRGPAAPENRRPLLCASPGGVEPDACSHNAGSSNTQRRLKKNPTRLQLHVTTCKKYIYQLVARTRPGAPSAKKGSVSPCIRLPWERLRALDPCFHQRRPGRRLRAGAAPGSGRGVRGQGFPADVW